MKYLILILLIVGCSYKKEEECKYHSKHDYEETLNAFYFCLDQKDFLEDHCNLSEKEWVGYRKFIKDKKK